VVSHKDMKILLVGEYSRLHNSLKEGLMALGHQVILMGDGDYFKNYPVDIKLNRPFQKGLPKRLKNLIFRLSGFDVSSWLMLRSAMRHKKALQGHDIVQLINESPLGIMPKHELKLVQWLAAHNDKLFVMACGTDYISVKFAMDQNFRYSILEPLFQGKVSQKQYAAILKYLSPGHLALHKSVSELCHGYIASDLDYALPYRGLSKYLGLIPNPINMEHIKFIPQKKDKKPLIFHGVNTKNYYKKGSDYFDQALEIVTKERPNSCEIMRTQDLPYHEYRAKLTRSDIVLDQVLGYDQGYNALEAMAQGKVLLTCAEKEWREHYHIPEHCVALNALPDAQKIANLIIELIDHPAQRVVLGEQARQFIEEHHDYKKVSQKYLDLWSTGRGSTSSPRS